MNDYDGYVNGHIERTAGGDYTGTLTVEGINLSPIEGQYFKKDGDTYLFIKRRPIMEYDYDKGCYNTRERKPSLLIYLKKVVGGDGVVAYKGSFMFMRFKFNVEGVWDAILGKERNRLNLFVERAPMSEQLLLKSVAEKRKKQ